MRDAGQASRLSRLKLGTLSARAGFWRPGAFLCLIAIAGFTASPATASPGVPGPIDALTAVDVSDSMFGPGGSDPHGARYRAVEVAAAMLCLHSSAGIEHRIGVLPFGSTAPARLAGAPTDACNAQRFSPRRLRGIPRLGGTDYPTMLRAARQLLGRPVAGHSRVLMLVTDGRPHVAAGETLDALFLRVARELQALRGVRVHVVLINSDREVLRHWRSLPIAAVTPLRDVNRQALERVALRTLAYEFGLARREELTLKAGGASRGFTVPPYQDLLGLTVRARGREAEVTIDGPSGPYRIRTVAGGVGDISVPAPAPGRWTVRLTRGSGATLAVDRHEPTLRVIEPPAAAPAGRPLYIEATLTPLNGGQIRSRSADPVVVSARVTGADNQVVNTEMRETVPGRYRSTQPVDTRDAGAFTAVVTARGGGVPFSHATRRVDVRYMPYLVAQAALAVHAGQRIELPLVLKVGGDEVDAQQTLAEDPNAAVVAELRSEGKFVRSYAVAWQGGSKFALRVPHDSHDGERITLTVRLAARTGDGATVSDRLTLAATARTTSDDIWKQRAGAVALVLAMLIAALTVLYAVWLLSRRSMQGRWVADDLVFTPRGKTRLRRGKGSTALWLWGTKHGAAWRRGRLPFPIGATPAQQNTVTRARRHAGDTLTPL